MIHEGQNHVATFFTLTSRQPAERWVAAFSVLISQCFKRFVSLFLVYPSRVSNADARRTDKAVPARRNDEACGRKAPNL